ncbi:spermidine synthase family protein [Hoyosella subflava]|uniref:Spermidine synthase n=1 Tax=Hoyosella subflava (strain DSM 45089 / JCM 17490 / NBRC 109087 / DQS3-9A1) TaxID=443218 RepID=F6EJZ3_HOYSD|nr:hypothetical protein [Hoyosella subflava]AEF41351.1 hypothetical protein AS9A_2904 [Hoyosella subflava DQS3-9A1]
MRFEELAHKQTAIGEVSLRRRWDPAVQKDVYEVKLDDDYLMSSLFTVAEEDLARIALTHLDGAHLHVAVGGLGLGYTALTVLDDPRVDSLIVIDALAEVISWHEEGLIPAGRTLMADSRCRFVCADFFELNGTSSLDPQRPDQRFDAVIVDIDHSPKHVLHPKNAAFYSVDGLRQLATHIQPGGVFALWSNDAPDDRFITRLSAVFASADARVVEFPNPLQGGQSANTVYLAITADANSRTHTSGTAT